MAAGLIFPQKTEEKRETGGKICFSRQPGPSCSKGG